MNRLHPIQLVTALLLGIALLPACFGQEVVEGREYKLIVPAQQPRSDGKIEVMEFFSYACPHCAEFEPNLQAWTKRKPKDVEYRMMPMIFREPRRQYIAGNINQESRGQLASGVLI